MKEEKRIITGITVSEQMERANEILENVVIPRSNLFEKRKKENSLSIKPDKSIKVNA